jgi:hypothetical protein
VKKFDLNTCGKADLKQRIGANELYQSRYREVIEE